MWQYWASIFNSVVNGVLFLIVVHQPNHICNLDIGVDCIKVTFKIQWRFYARINRMDWDDSARFERLY